MPAELSVQILSEEGIIYAIDATIDNALIVFVKNSDGEFATSTENQIDKPYMAYLIRQLNRTFGRQ